MFYLVYYREKKGREETKNEDLQDHKETELIFPLWCFESNAFTTINDNLEYRATEMNNE